ncbi:cytochrome P450 [Streptomyces sp. NPDC059010]|uniref:cytochrome P450 n=1 Tax=Streptomyces sp. NPDC059010 TaxID=3346695 RepID=UPI00368FFBAC
MDPITTLPAPPAAPGALPLAGHLWQLVRNPLLFFERQHRGAGVVVVRIGPKPVHLVTRPGLVRRLLTDPVTFDKGGIFIDGVRALAGNGVATCPTADHAVQRPILQPAFHRRRIVEYSTAMRAGTDELSRSWHDGQHLDVVRVLHRLAADVVTRTLFSGPGAAHAAREIQRLFPPMLAGLYRRLIVPVAWPHRLPLPANTEFDAALHGIRRIIAQEIAGYRADGRDRGDLLSAMMHARDERTGATLTDTELNEQVIGMLMAAIETTGSAAAWLLHSLATHPEVEEAVLAELRDTVGDRDLNAHDAGSLPVLRRAMTEVLRLYPPFWLLSRVTTRPSELGGYRIPARADVVFSLYCLQRAPEAFPRPHRFEPDRWLPDRVTAGQKDAQMPFGVGTRKCIGDMYGQTEIPLIVGTLLRHWRFRHATGRTVVPLVKGTMRPSPLLMVVTRRTAAFS